MNHVRFTDRHGSFTMENPENTSYLYFPLASETGLKSSITPNLGGDSKINQDSFLLEPVSSENLHNNRSCRNFWCAVDGAGIYSAAGVSLRQEAAKFSPEQDKSRLTAGFMWHTLERTSRALRIRSTVTSFIPAKESVEIMHIVIQNISEFPQNITPWAAIPIYGRSADNIRDHRHVTSLLHRIQTTENGILVCPTMSFNEKGHRKNRRIYYVVGCTGEGGAPERFYPTVEAFIGEGGSYTRPRAVYEHTDGFPSGYDEAGKEAMGAFRFPGITLAPDEKADYIVLLGVEENRENIQEIYKKYNTSHKISMALEQTRTYWQDLVNIDFHTQDPSFDCLMKWIGFQPFLRRIFGCSFLPYHDYGRGGRGWRDLWQDCLSLLFMDPQTVGETIAANYGGVRIDGTNATIIGEGDGHFIADRNGISRVWMDHALWPLKTTRLYIDQTGDIGILDRQVPYFKDGQIMRGTEYDSLWNEEYGNKQRTCDHTVYTGSILEHLLIQQLTAFYDVGEHNMYRLRGADWNDALDMAPERGESVAFTCAYAGNLMELADLILLLDSRFPDRPIPLLEEIGILLHTDPALFEDVSGKKEVLREFTHRCRHNISGKRTAFSPSFLADNLNRKAAWLTEYVRKQEWIEGHEGDGWFNSYYDNHGQAVEGFFQKQVRMMLTGQVFAIMGHVATDAQIRKITKSADRYLYEQTAGGYRLNTDFRELKFDMGRMFGFAYGEKENGAVFSHMTVMYANALYQRGFAREGWKALKSLADTALDFSASRIYPGIPEYFRSDGRGMYPYLTGAASWYLMTMIAEVFGVRGVSGDLIFDPKLLAEQFTTDGTASVLVTFAGKRLHIIYRNESRKDFGAYAVISAQCDNTQLTVVKGAYALLPRHVLAALSNEIHTITIILL